MTEQVGTWYLIKYVRDLARREPVNIGIAYKSADGWETRFVGQASDGTIASRLSHGLIRESYTEWVDYFSRQAAREAWSAVLEHQGRRPVNFYAERGGVLLDDADGSGVDGLFGSLVGSVSTTPSDQNVVKSAVGQIFERAHIEPTKEQVVEAVWAEGAPIRPITFDYGYQNGELHLISALTARRDLVLHADATNARITAARRAGAARSFWVFFSGEVAGLDIDEVLTPLDRLAHTIDVDQIDDAASKVMQLVKH